MFNVRSKLTASQQSIAQCWKLKIRQETKKDKPLSSSELQSPWRQSDMRMASMYPKLKYSCVVYFVHIIVVYYIKTSHMFFFYQERMLRCTYTEPDGKNITVS